MTLYHGSDGIVQNPNLGLARKTLDFGPGFYTTTNREQAINFAHKVMLRNETKNRFVSVYDFDIEEAKHTVSILQFDEPNKQWLDFVHKNRRGIYDGAVYDLVIGPVANDDVFATLTLYENGILNEEQTIEALKLKKLFNQYVIKSEGAVSFLCYQESFNAGETV